MTPTVKSQIAQVFQSLNPNISAHVRLPRHCQTGDAAYKLISRHLIYLLQDRHRHRITGAGVYVRGHGNADHPHAHLLLRTSSELLSSLDTRRSVRTTVDGKDGWSLPDRDLLHDSLRTKKRRSVFLTDASSIDWTPIKSVEASSLYAGRNMMTGTDGELLTFGIRSFT